MSHIVLNNISFYYKHPQVLLSNISGKISGKIGLVGDNGCGKSTLLKLIAQQLIPTSGSIEANGKLGYLPQKLELLDNLSLGEYLDLDNQTEDAPVFYKNLEYFLSILQLSRIDFSRLIGSLSGGERTRFALLKICLNEPDILVLDEPTNHLDCEGQKIFFDFFKKWEKTVIVSSHNRELLQQVEAIFEVSQCHLKIYGGNFTFYESKKAEEVLAAEKEFLSAKATLKKTERKMRQVSDKKDKSDRRGHDLRAEGGIPKMTRNAMKNRSENTQSRIAKNTQKALSSVQERKSMAFSNLEVKRTLALNLNEPSFSSNKCLLRIENISFSYDEKTPIFENLSLSVFGSDRIAIAGKNGTGKSTLLDLIAGKLEPQAGTIQKFSETAYIDQKLSFLDEAKTILENVLILNPELAETEIRNKLALFLFFGTDIFKKAKELSGGEKLRLALSCCFLKQTSPLLLLDEPTNNLDLRSIQVLESALKNYTGALLIVSHDDVFLQNTHVDRKISLV
ncbi:MAG: hypothetical protein A2007_06400 [Verrucomicrobia bacterium GWC2_42_7]|nr:MAG: hypothetical protein A2007_06400 [Verrucomicrobia bacterium GWC2_42_7]